MTGFGLAIMVVPETILVRRSWRERLLSWPWRPLRATREIPNPLCNTIEGNVARVSQSYYEKLKESTRCT